MSCVKMFLHRRILVYSRFSVVHHKIKDSICYQNITRFIFTKIKSCRSITIYCKEKSFGQVWLAKFRIRIRIRFPRGQLDVFSNLLPYFFSSWIYYSIQDYRKLFLWYCWILNCARNKILHNSMFCYLKVSHFERI